MRSKGGPRWMALSRYSFELTILKRNRRTMRAAIRREVSEILGDARMADSRGMTEMPNTVRHTVE